MTSGQMLSGRRRTLRLLMGVAATATLLAGCGKWSMPKMHMPNWLWWKKPPAELPLVDELAIVSQAPGDAGERIEQRRDYETLVLDIHGGAAGDFTMTRRDADRPWPFHLVLRFHLPAVAVLDVYGDQRLHLTPGAPNYKDLVVVLVPTHVYSARTDTMRVQWSADGAATAPAVTP